MNLDIQTTAKQPFREARSTFHLVNIRIKEKRQAGQVEYLHRNKTKCYTAHFRNTSWISHPKSLYVQGADTVRIKINDVSPP